MPHPQGGEGDGAAGDQQPKPRCLPRSVTEVPGSVPTRPGSGSQGPAGPRLLELAHRTGTWVW